MNLRTSGNEEIYDTREPMPPRGPAPVPARSFEAAFGEPLSRTLDLDTWRPGEHLADLYHRLEREIAAAVQQESGLRKRVRAAIFPLLSQRPDAPADAGVWKATSGEIERIHQRLLFTGRVEVCDGSSVVHDTLPVTISQLGACLVSYQGDQSAWVQRVYRRDLRMRGLDPVDEVLELLEQRRQRTGLEQTSRRDTLTELASRGIMTYAERAVLLRKATAPWRMGHGNPFALELLAGSSELAALSLDMLRELTLGHQRFVFVSSAPADRVLLTIGNALRPLEYAIVDTMEDWIGTRALAGHDYGEWAPLMPRLRQFATEVGSQVVRGVYRASDVAPAYVFYAHRAHVHIAARIALADSILHGHRGFPMLIELADAVCRATFGVDAFTATSHVAYAEAGAPFQYLAERQTRK